MIVLLTLAPLSGAGFDLFSALRKVEDRYNNVKTMQLDFEQSLVFRSQPTARRTESGVLYLRKPGKMRWDYRDPAKKLFLSDGKDVYFYSPSTNRVEKSKLKETEDMRAPLAFLLGKLDFQRDFREYRDKPEGLNHWITAIPKSDKAPYKQVEFLLLANGPQISKLRVLGHDDSIMEFSFRNERMNPILDEKLFQFQPLPGVEVMEVSQ